MVDQVPVLVVTIRRGNVDLTAASRQIVNVGKTEGQSEGAVAPFAQN